MTALDDAPMKIELPDGDGFAEHFEVALCPKKTQLLEGAAPKKSTPADSNNVHLLARITGSVPGAVAAGQFSPVTSTNVAANIASVAPARARTSPSSTLQACFFAAKVRDG